MIDQIKKIKQEAENELKKVTTSQELDTLRLKYLSRKGLISSLFSGLKEVDAKERGIIGQKINQLKNDVESSYKELEDRLKSDQESEEDVDLFLPGRKPFIGRLHPLTIVMDEIKQIFFNLGFRVEDLSLIHI